VGAGLGPRGGGLDSHPGHGGRAVSVTGVHQFVVAADCDALDAALGELRAAGWSAPEDPDFGEDAELDGRDTIADRLSDERPPAAPAPVMPTQLLDQPVI